MQGLGHIQEKAHLLTVVERALQVNRFRFGTTVREAKAFVQRDSWNVRNEDGKVDAPNTVRFRVCNGVLDELPPQAAPAKPR